jgi:hypothetical protein
MESALLTRKGELRLLSGERGGEAQVIPFPQQIESDGSPGVGRP